MAVVALQTSSSSGDGMKRISKPSDLIEFSNKIVAYTTPRFVGSETQPCLNEFYPRIDGYQQGGAYFAWIRPELRAGLLEGPLDMENAIHKMYPLMRSIPGNRIPASVHLSWHNLPKNHIRMRLATEKELHALKSAVFDEKTADFDVLPHSIYVAPFTETNEASLQQCPPKKAASNEANLRSGQH